MKTTIEFVCDVIVGAGLGFGPGCLLILLGQCLYRVFS